jgi:uracil DNA glycosylase
MIPKRENTFRALNEINGEIKVVIFGQDPYPREESANGIAFFDNAIKNWDDKLSPSFRNLIKNVLICESMLKTTSKIVELRNVLKKNKIISPPEWFKHTQEQGVCWLNIALTFESKDTLNKHTTFWKNIIKEIILEIIKNSKNGLVFVLWGGHAKKLKSFIPKDKKIKFVEANHPSVESFHKIETFKKINEELKSLKLKEINWIKKIENGKDLNENSKKIENEKDLNESSKKRKNEITDYFKVKKKK